MLVLGGGASSHKNFSLPAALRFAWYLVGRRRVYVYHALLHFPPHRLFLRDRLVVDGRIRFTLRETAAFSWCYYGLHQLLLRAA